MYNSCGVVINRVIDPSLNSQLDLLNLSVLASIEDDKNHAVNEVLHGSIFSLPKDSLLLQGARKALSDFEII